MTTLVLLALAGLVSQDQQKPKLVSNGLEGYIGMNVAAHPDAYGYGVSLYATAWPLVANPIRDFQIGLASIWIIPDNRKINYPLLPHGTLARDNWPERGPSYRDVFQTIEGGLGFWGNTRYWTLAAKFRMNGTANGYNHEISTPGWGFGGGEGDAKALSPEQMGIAQLSSHLLVPPDGLTFKRDTIGQLFGYAWMALPLTDAKKTTAGLSVPTGNQCWTLFLNSTNFKGPVAFYTPVTWSRISRHYPPAVGRGLDALPGVVSGGAIEVNTVPRFVAQAGGKEFSKIPALQFPTDSQGRTVLIHNMTFYSKQALYNEVAAWQDGGPAPSGLFNAGGSVTPKCSAWPLSVQQGDPKAKIVGLEDWVSPAVFDDSTFGLKWNPKRLTKWIGKVEKADFPEYFEKQADGIEPIESSQLPRETGLQEAQFPSALDETAYTSPGPGRNVWAKPGPASGPIKVKLADGSVVTYSWYKFIDQPSLQDADLSASEKIRLQAIVVKMQKAWTAQKEYMAPPRIGKLAGLDPALLVNPPKGMEYGYVPIATRQDPPSAADRNKH